MYSRESYLSEPCGNNIFAWEQRKKTYGRSPTLTIPSLIEGGISDVQISNNIVFEEIENGILKSCVGLKYFIHIPSSSEKPPITIFDNHNHALYFWIDAVRRWILEPGFELIHIDEHSDLWENPNTLNLEKALRDEQYTWDFANLSCNVGNYIVPAMQSRLVGNMIRIENESQMNEHMNHAPWKSSLLNLDLDIFAPELDFIPEDKKIKIIRNLLKQVDYVTIATSPFFIDQWRAIEKIHKILR